ncbi:chorismate mutase [Streptomyces sp. WMMC940]|uniref:chorismate mutase n=1 Tax=Streptomyces sp. WMMC940 TaxID=3015153 RepID=UPI0022B69A95|nr:chorismate mutase [Streptomyces sp. WMMC940]MCZ7460336.1 chorismate mutase [Streptomyces sp. WMMC940]
MTAPVARWRAAAPTHTDGREIRMLLDDLDGQIISMLLRRAELARYEQSARRRSGLPASELARENWVLTRYAVELGRQGADIGRAVLVLSHLAHGVPTARHGQRDE